MIFFAQGLKELISVIVPFHNEKKRLKKCVESILKQELNEGFEVILVDDESTDGSVEIAEGLKGKRVRVLRQRRAGPAKARNLGVKNAKGEIVVFIDADCEAAGNWLREMVKPIREGKAVGVQGIYKTRQRELMARFIQLEIEGRYRLMGKGEGIDFIGTYSAAYDRKVLAGGFDESFPIASGEDTELSYKLSEKGFRLVINPEAVVFHLHPVSLKEYLKVKFFRALWRFRLYKKHSGKMVKDSYTPQALKLQVGFFYLGIVLFLAGFLYREAVFLSGLLFLAVFLLGVPFGLRAARKDLAVGSIAPVVLFYRTVVFGLGLAAGFLNGFKK